MRWTLRSYEYSFGKKDRVLPQRRHRKYYLSHPRTARIINWTWCANVHTVHLLCSYLGSESRIGFGNGVDRCSRILPMNGGVGCCGFVSVVKLLFDASWSVWVWRCGFCEWLIFCVIGFGYLKIFSIICSYLILI